MPNIRDLLRSFEREQRTELNDRLRVLEDFSTPGTPGDFAGVATTVTIDRHTNGRPYHVVGVSPLGSAECPRVEVVAP
jgi:hypothetical protein